MEALSPKQLRQRRAKLTQNENIRTDILHSPVRLLSAHSGRWGTITNIEKCTRTLRDLVDVSISGQSGGARMPALGNDEQVSS